MLMDFLEIIWFFLSHRGRLAVANDGKRHVYMGRGYTYQIPDPYPQIEDNVSSLYERRINVSIQKEKMEYFLFVLFNTFCI